ncbi:hypothetical protein HN371_21070 [Candidatus Poribacteria bacterium]|jgi:hypothetical protein|nr:hypothetical protein [Candidatus Poribacteria bacterium]MBT5536221.1 hypothetical protein [Candidatus Poribacteria bacterium]MBT5714046.1 hypothetical protein [Candidatus Poribacteria bacterium]MBT7097796.1 hypothetical protein [Candidatus Poribacteria bacterium]MBT7805922.1 hypothetical protein [Candidatus Poribacteria bacterium]
MRRSLILVALAALLAAPSDVAFGFSKTAQKVVFATGLLAFGGVVRALIRRDRSRTAERVRELRAEWGEPVDVTTTDKGFDTIRVETYQRDGRTAWATFRNGRLIRVRFAAESVDGSIGVDGVGDLGHADHGRRPVPVRPDS